MNIKTNFSFFLVLLGIIILAFIEGIAINGAIFKEQVIQGSEIQLIAFIIIAIVMVTVSTLRPNKLILVAYSSMTLGLIVITTGLFDPTNKAPVEIKITEVVVGTILIIAGFLMTRGLRLNVQESMIAKEGIKAYKKL